MATCLLPQGWRPSKVRVKCRINNNIQLYVKTTKGPFRRYVSFLLSTVIAEAVKMEFKNGISHITAVSYRPCATISAGHPLLFIAPVHITCEHLFLI